MTERDLANILSGSLPLIPEQLESLAVYLHEKDIAAGPSQILAAQRLLWRLAERGFDLSAKELAVWLAPVFCTNPTDQQRFSTLYIEWLNQEHPNPTPPRPKPLPWWRVRWWIPVAGVLLIGATALFLPDRFTPSPALPEPVAPKTEPPVTSRLPPGTVVAVSGQARDRTSTAPVAGATVWVAGSHSGKTDDLGRFQVRALVGEPVLLTHCAYDAALFALARNEADMAIPMWKKAAPVCGPPPPPIAGGRPDSGLSAARDLALRILLTALPLLLLAGLFAYLICKRLGLRRLAALGNIDLKRLPVQSSASRIFEENEIQRAVQEMRRPRPASVEQLWLERSVVATAENAGWFTPVYSARKTTPAYLILVDRAGKRDQQARLAEEMIARLKEQRVVLEIFSFNGDPRTCFEARTGGRTALTDLSGRYGSYTLLIVSEGRRLANPFTGRLQGWTDIFDQWNSRTLMTPLDPAQWSTREESLMRRGFVVMPAGFHGLALLEHMVARSMDRETPSPPSLDYRPNRWTDPTPAPAREIARLQTELHLYLGRDGYRWLSACALFPVCEWSLTLALAARIVKPAELPAMLRKLVRLPWFRTGTMPDWLRAAFLGGMDPALRRQSIAWLNEFVTQPGDSRERIDIVDGAPAPKGSRGEITDEILLCFLWGKDPSDFVIKRPGALRRFFFRNGRIWKGVNLLPPLIALASSVAIWLGTAGLTAPLPVGAPEPAPPIAALALDVVRSQYHDSLYFRMSMTAEVKVNVLGSWCYLIVSHLVNSALTKTMVAAPQPGDTAGSEETAAGYRETGVVTSVAKNKLEAAYDLGDGIRTFATTPKALFRYAMGTGLPTESLPPYPFSVNTGILRRGLILWVDDHPEANSLLAQSLNQAGYQVDQVTSTSEALKRLDSGAFAAVISDMTRDTPDAGFQFLKAFRVTNRTVPFYFYTTPSEVDQWKQLIARAGADGIADNPDELFRLVVNGKHERRDTVPVSPQPSPSCPKILSFTATPSRIAPGATSRLQFTFSGDSRYIGRILLDDGSALSPDFIRNGSGQLSVRPDKTTNYRLEYSPDCGVASRDFETVVVTVSPKDQDVTSALAEFRLNRVNDPTFDITSLADVLSTPLAFLRYLSSKSPQARSQIGIQAPQGRGILDAIVELKRLVQTTQAKDANGNPRTVSVRLPNGTTQAMPITIYDDWLKSTRTALAYAPHAESRVAAILKARLDVLEQELRKLDPSLDEHVAAALGSR